MDLQQELINLKQRLATEQPPEIPEANQRMIEALSSKRIATRGPQVGDSIYSFDNNFNFHLPDLTGQEVEFSKILAAGPVVLSFYRGGWCPFCNLEMKVLKAESAAIRKLGAQLIAVSPELPESSFYQGKKEGLGFYVLSDVENTTAKKLNISFEVPSYLFQTLKMYGLDLEKYHGLEKVELPIPATYVIDVAGNINYAFASEDFTKRASVIGILKALEKIKEG